VGVGKDGSLRFRSNRGRYAEAAAAEVEHRDKPMVDMAMVASKRSSCGAVKETGVSEVKVVYLVEFRRYDVLGVEVKAMERLALVEAIR
jgi:hypothetical protein